MEKLGIETQYDNVMITNRGLNTFFSCQGKIALTRHRKWC